MVHLTWLCCSGARKIVDVRVEHDQRITRNKRRDVGKVVYSVEPESETTRSDQAVKFRGLADLHEVLEVTVGERGVVVAAKVPEVVGVLRRWGCQLWKAAEAVSPWRWWQR